MAPLKTYLLSLLLTASPLLAHKRDLPIPEFTQEEIDSGAALRELNRIAGANAHRLFGNNCSPATVKIRREWRALSKPERRQFIAAVKCIMAKPNTVLSQDEVPGAKSLYDAIVWAHADRSGYMHMSGNFLVFHRYYLHTYERELALCGWDQGLPYWEWGLDVDAPHLSPVFDGSDTSLGSDGAFIPNRPPRVLDFIGFDEPTIIPPGTGGGCVMKGPFSDMVVRLGPIDVLPGEPIPSHPEEGREENPRCLERDLNADPLRRWNTFRNVTELILGYRTIREFQGTLDGDPRVTRESMGAHSGGHEAIGGIAVNPMLSPYDPAFWLTHNMLERVYWIWQLLDFKNRQGVHGTGTFLNMPPSANVTVEDELDLSPHNGPVKIKDLMNSLSGAPLCYVYV
ncbi:hypothetical protein VTJ49DRAFT_7722 [Mycothermus thermophilus]|uniref:Tyrosinase copper-binding domain-containing protein n=1 Tax=Humicola insolens TaxID=85995 RepID=A0ABR3VGP0_HUMIN